MDKRKEKRTQYNADIVKALQEKYGFKPNYIRMSIKGERIGTIPLKIQEEYKKLNAAAQKAIKRRINSL